MRAGLAVAIACIGFAGFACADGSSVSEGPGANITADELVDRIGQDAAPFVLDVRTPGEFANGHVPGAVNVPHTELASRLASLPQDRETELVVMCERGGRADAAAEVLRDAGYTNLRDLEGHMQAWRAANRPTE